MPSAFAARLGTAATVVVACSCTALLGLDDKQFTGGSGGAGGASSSSTSSGTTTSGTTSSTGGTGGAHTTSSSSSSTSSSATCPGADLMNDPLNCGRCSHDCLGGACLAGACQPVSVSQGQGIVFTYALALDANWVYYVIQQGSQLQLRFRGVHDLPGATTGSLVAVDGISSLAAAGGYVGWTTVTSVDGGSAGGAFALMAQGSPAPTTLLQGAGLFDAMVGHGQYFSFATNQQNLVTAVPGAPPTTVAASNIGSIAADASHVYWTLNSGEIVAGDVTGMGGQTLLTDVGARLLATREGDPSLYWWIFQAGSTGSIRTAPKTGGPAVTLGSPTLSALSVAVDAEAVYAASLPPSCPGTPNGRIQRVDLATHQETLLPGVICPFVVAADDVCIYWTDPNAGGLMRLAK